VGRVTVLVVAAGRVVEVREEGVVRLGRLPTGVDPRMLRPGARVVQAEVPAGVVDIGEAGTRVGGRVIGVGGRDLDAAVRALLPGEVAPEDVRTVREALSLCPAGRVTTSEGPVRVTAEQVREAITPLLARVVEALPRDVPLLLTGGVARTPLLAELCDAAGRTVAVAPRPEWAVVERAAHAVRGAGPAATASPPPRPFLEVRPPPRRRRPRRVAAAAAGLLVGLGLLGIGTLLPVPAEGLVAHGFRIAVPAGWAHVGGDAERRRVLLAPRDTPDGSALVVVERTPLGYDADLEPARAVAELRARHAAAGGSVSALRVDGGWVRYREGPVEWAVRFEGTDELAVGCRAPAAEAACALVRDSLGLA
jgi:hypothetical protein